MTFTRLIGAAAAGLMLTACEGTVLDPDTHITWVPLGQQQVPLLNPGTVLADAAAAVQARFPNLRAARRARDPSWRDAHPAAGVTFGELAGFGVTMVRQTGNQAIPGPDDFAVADGDLSNPTLLFFDRTGGGGPGQWPIIGMGFGWPSIDFDGDGVSDPPVIFPQVGEDRIDWIVGEAVTFLRDGMLLHEAGYHTVLNPRPDMRMATTADLTAAALASGLVIDANGDAPIGHDDMRNIIGLGRHGRIWAMHVWFDPASGLPTVSPCDPWRRQRDGAAALPANAFYYRDRPGSQALVLGHCLAGGVYPTIADQAP